MIRLEIPLRSAGSLKWDRSILEYRSYFYSSIGATFLLANQRRIIIPIPDLSERFDCGLALFDVGAYSVVVVSVAGCPKEVCVSRFAGCYKHST